MSQAKGRTPSRANEKTRREAPDKAANHEPHSSLTPISPIDLRPLAPVTVSTGDEIKKAVDLARAAQEHWRNQSFSERHATLKQAAKELLRRRAEIIALCQAEIGKVASEGLFNEALGPIETLNGWSAVVKQAAMTRRVHLNPLSFPKKQARVEYVPRGVIGIIAPWNFPAAGLYRSVFPALLTGNGVVLKPSEYSPESSAWLVTQLGALLPSGLVEVVQGAGDVGSALIDAGIDACVFTGSTASGRQVAVHCAARGIPSSIEMGGKDAAIVLADCDLERTIASICHWTLSNVGQSCGAIEVAYVDEAIADPFVERLAKSFARLSLGNEPDADIGPLANQKQLAIVTEQINDAKAKGAEVVIGGSATGQGLCFSPTILDHCTEEMTVLRDETFGPVLAVVRIKGADEAIRAINDGRYGLGASIWTSDLTRGQRLGERLNVGVVTVNNHAFTGAVPSLPWSGTRDTGFGIANGPESLYTFVRPRTVVIDKSNKMEPFWMPYDRDLLALGEVLADAQLGRLSGAWRLPLLLRKRLKTIRTFFRQSARPSR